MNNKFSRKDFLEALFGEYLSIRDGFIRVMTLRSHDRKVSTRYFPKLETLAKEVYQDNQHVFFGVCPHENMKPEKSNVRYMVAIWGGLDLNSDGFSGKNSYFSDMSYAAKAVRSFPLPPSIVVESGWGVHLYWLLKNVREIGNPERVEQVLATINTYFLCEKPIGVDSMLRLPETFNSKFASSVVKCNIKYLNTEFRYDFEEFEDLKLVSMFPRSRARSVGAALAEAEETVPENELLASQSEEAVGYDHEEVASYLETKVAETTVARAQAAASPAFAHQPAVHQPPRQQTVELSTAAPAEVIEESTAETVEVVAEDASEAFADEVVDKVVTRLSAKLMDKMVDEIVEKLYQRIMNSSGKL